MNNDANLRYVIRVAVRGAKITGKKNKVNMFVCDAEVVEVKDVGSG